MSYMSNIHHQSPARLWVNNPTMAELDLALQHHAIGVTTNPTYSANQIKRAPDVALPIIRQAIKESDDDAMVADIVQQRLIERLLPAYQGLYEASAGAVGFVSIQGNPLLDEDAENIIDEARRYRKMGDNIVAKIPATKAGLIAIETLLKENVPCIATEVFGLPQLYASVEAYQRAYRSSGYRPAYFITHITGIFDQHIAEWAATAKPDITPDILSQAGTLLAHRQYQVHNNENLPGVLLGGGARQNRHFTDMLGGTMQITINWSTADELIADNPPLVDRIHQQPDQAVVDELLAKVPDFAASWERDNLSIDQFDDYGPVQCFRNMFVTGWQTLLDTIKNERAQARAS